METLRLGLLDLPLPSPAFPPLLICTLTLEEEVVVGGGRWGRWCTYSCDGGVEGEGGVVEEVKVEETP